MRRGKKGAGEDGVIGTAATQSRRPEHRESKSGQDPAINKRKYQASTHPLCERCIEREQRGEEPTLIVSYAMYQSPLIFFSFICQKIT